MPVGMVSTYDLTVGVQLEVEDMIHVISPFDVPLLGGGGADGNTVLSSDTVFEKKYEWLDEELLIPRTTVGTTFVTAATEVITAAGQRERFQTGDLIKINAEIVRVSGYSATTADTLLVTRAYDGSAGQHAVGAEMVGVGSALPEGSDPPSPRTRDRVNRFNYTEIFGPYAVQVSGTEQVVRKYGLPMSEFDYQVSNRTKEAFVAIEQALVYGARVEDTSNEWRSMGGINYFITTNVNSTTTDITEAALLDQLQTVFAAGGSPDRILVGPAQKRKISQLTDSSLMRVVNANDARGRTVSAYESDFGQLSIIMSRWVRSSDLFIFNRDQATVLTLRPLVFEMLAKTGDSVKGQVVGEKGFAFRRQQHAAKFTALAV